jgi:succinate dehydrogenase / fumarate reductase iron-sulfur subunit
MKLTLKIWRQKDRNDEGRFVDYPVQDVSPDMVIPGDARCAEYRTGEKRLKRPLCSTMTAAKESAEAAGMMINGRAHGPGRGIATCQLHMRSFQEGDEIIIEPVACYGIPGY